MQQAQRRSDTRRFLSTGARGKKKKLFIGGIFDLQALEEASGSNSILSYAFTTALLQLYYSFTTALLKHVEEQAAAILYMNQLLRLLVCGLPPPPFPPLFFSPLGQLPEGFTGSNWFPPGKFIVVGGGRL